jgi:hypothetical protein
MSADTKPQFKALQSTPASFGGLTVNLPRKLRWFKSAPAHLDAGAQVAGPFWASAGPRRGFLRSSRYLSPGSDGHVRSGCRTGCGWSARKHAELVAFRVCQGDPPASVGASVVLVQGGT